MSFISVVQTFAAAAVLAQTPGAPPLVRVPTLDRLKKVHLQQLHADVAALQAKRQTVSLKTGFKDIRVIIHCHSFLSHDSRGKIDDMAASAKSVNVRALFVSDHPKSDLDVIANGKHGMVDDVLFVPGSETNGFCIYPGDYKMPPLNVSEQMLVDSIDATDGMIFIAHPEEHKDWDLKGLTGTEVYNTHADLLDEKPLLATLQPKNGAGYLGLMTIFNAVKDYPRETFACIFDRPVDNLKHYDYICRNGVIAATAGNDSHQNTGIVVYGTEDHKYRITDALDSPVAILDPAKLGFAKAIFGEPIPGKELFRRQLDPYPISMGYVSTHVLADDSSEATLRKALHAARTYVAFDWIADPTGTAFILQAGRKIHNIGESVPAKARGMEIKAEVPIPCSLTLYRDGNEIAHADGRTLNAKVGEPGVYRMVASFTLDGETRDWIYTGAIRIAPKTTSRAN